MRIASSQGVITKCNIALAGNLSGTAPCINIGVFNTDGVLLGQSGLIWPTQGVELLTVNMNSEFDDALRLKRNTRYLIQVWSCGCQLAAYSHGTSYNYSYDYTLRQNLMTSTSAAAFVATDSASFSRSDVQPFVSFGATEIN